MALNSHVVERMKKLSFVLVFTAILGLVCLSACTTEQKDGPGAVSIICDTSDATTITSTSALLNGTAFIEGAEAGYANAYFYYSTTTGDAKALKTMGQRITAGTIPNTGGDFLVNLNSLLPATTYYYIASVSISDQEELGSVKSFTTLDKPAEIAITGDATEIGKRSATIYGWSNQETSDGTPVVFGIEYSSTDLTIAAVSATASEKDAENKYSCVLTKLSSSTLYYYRAFTLYKGVRYYGEVKSFTTEYSEFSDCPEGAEDLDIVMTKEDGTKYKLYWAKSNLSGTGLCPSPEDFGDYFAWGETEARRRDGWVNYKWCNGSNNTLTKYNTNSSYGSVDNKTVLDPEDDVAHVTLGGKWRMPTKEEWTALIEECTWKMDDHFGYVVTGTNGNSIYLPAPSYKIGNYDYPSGQLWYWSSSLDADNPDCSWFYTSWVAGLDISYRCYLYSVRPVSE